MFLSEEDDILERWTEHCDELLNTEFFNQNETRQETDQTHLATDKLTPTSDEVQNAINKLKNNKASQTDLIQAKLIKNTGPEFIQYMYQLTAKTWTNKIIPEELEYHMFITQEGGRDSMIKLQKNKLAMCCL